MSAESSREFYNSLPNPIWCNILQCNIYFTARGYNHLLRNGRGHRRHSRERNRRLSLLPFVTELFVRATSYEYRYEADTETKYWGITGTTATGKRIKIIVKKVGQGKITFWSVM